MRRLIILAGLLLIVSCVLGATAFRDQIASGAARAQPPTPVSFTNSSGTGVGNTVKLDPANNGVTVTNSSLSVQEQGTVTTLAAMPSHAFSADGADQEAIDGCGANLPAGTKWFISSFGGAANADLDGYVEVTTSGGTPVVGDWLHIMVKAGETNQLTFPQPYVLTSPADGDCLRFDLSFGMEGIVVGYRQ